MTMATLSMALSVLEHAENYSQVGRWYAITDFWSAEEILEELNSCEETCHVPFLLDANAICHFDGILHSETR